MTLREILNQQDDQMRLNDGATTWTVGNLLAELGDDEGDYTTGQTSDGRLQIFRLKSDGYRESVAAYTEEK